MQLSFRIAVVLLTLCFGASLPAQTHQWSLAATIPEFNLRSQQLVFPDSLHGYLFGWKPSVSANPTYEDGILYRTIDGGRTWQKIDFRTILGADTLWYNRISSNSTYLRFDAPTANSCVISNGGGGLSQDPDTLSFYWSANNGSSWFPTRTVPTSSRSKYLIEGAPHNHEVVALKVNGNFPNASGSGQYFVSATNGAVFDDIRWDSTLLNNLIVGRLFGGGHHTFDYFDDFTWIVTVSDKNNSSTGSLAIPYSLVTLLAKDLDSDSDPGTYWEAYYNTIPKFPSDWEAKYFESHCVRGSESVYMFSGYGGEGQYPFYGINYLYSSDQGRTWNFDSSFVLNGQSYRRAITASAPAEVWSSVIPFSSEIFPNTPAIWIAHSIDCGKSWTIDSISLHTGENKYYDGRTIAFSDKNHGWMYAQSVGGQNAAIFRYEAGSDDVPEISKTSNPNCTLYPNPAGDQIAIHTTDDLSISGITISDLLGRDWHCTVHISTIPSKAMIRTNTLPSGSYVAKVQHSGGTRLLPFIVRR